MGKLKIPLYNRKTFVFVDVSNIRYACRWSCNFDLNFKRFYQYLESKYKYLKEVRYYEGIASNDNKKKQYFQRLDKIGYTICSLERKSYTNAARYVDFKCSKCETINTVQILPENTKLKSNVDVYMAVDMMKCAIRATIPIHIILVSCDGDFTETIRGVLSVNPNIFVTVMATPMTKTNNCLSARLKNLRHELPDDMVLVDISTIQKHIAKP